MPRASKVPVNATLMMSQPPPHPQMNQERREAGELLCMPITPFFMLFMLFTLITVFFHVSCSTTGAWGGGRAAAHPSGRGAAPHV